jgi:hypothetical protein
MFFFIKKIWDVAILVIIHKEIWSLVYNLWPASHCSAAAASLENSLGTNQLYSTVRRSMLLVLVKKYQTK